MSLATAVVERRGHVSTSELDAARGAGLSEVEMLETVAIVVLDTFPHYSNALVKTKVDSPAAPPID